MDNITQEAKEAVTKAQQLVENYQSYAVTTQSELEAAALDLGKIKAESKRLEDIRKGITQPMDASKKAVMDFFRPPLDFLSKSERIIKGAIGKYNAEQEAIQREKQRQAEEAARKEQERLRRNAEARAKTQEKNGNVEEAEQIRETVPVVPVPVIATNTEKPSSIQYRDNWKGEFTDLDALIKAVAAGKAPKTLLIGDQKVLNKMATATKGTMEIPGVRIFNDRIVASKSA